MKDLKKDPIPNISAGPIDDNNLLKWQATIIGPVYSLLIIFNIMYLN